MFQPCFQASCLNWHPGTSNRVSPCLPSLNPVQKVHYTTHLLRMLACPCVAMFSHQAVFCIQVAEFSTYPIKPWSFMGWKCHIWLYYLKGMLSWGQGLSWHCSTIAKFYVTALLSLHIRMWSSATLETALPLLIHDLQRFWILPDEKS